MSENSLIPAPPASSLRLGTEPYPPAGAGTPPPPVNPLKMMHSFLRGHYILLTALIIALTPLGAWLGYQCGHKSFRTIGKLHIKPEMQKILFSTEENSTIPMFDEYMDTEYARITSRRVIENAAADPAWKVWRSQLPANLADRIAEELIVTHSTGSGMLEVTVWDDEQLASRLAVQTIMRAYSQIYEDASNSSQSQLMQTLSGLKTGEEAEVSDIRKKILQIADKYQGTEDLTKIHADAMDQLQKLQAYLMFAPTGGQAAMPGGATAQPPTEDEMIARSHPEFAEKLKQIDELKTELAIAKLDYGDKSFTITQKTRELNVIQQQVQGYRNDFEHASGLANSVAVANGSPATQPGATTRPEVQLRNTMMAEAAKIQNEVATIGHDMIDLQDRKDELAKAESKLARTTDRYDQLQLESNNGTTSRLEVVSDAAASNSARDVKDTHVALAALGGSTGVLFSVLIVALLSLSNRRFHGPEDTQYSQMRVPMLGMLPTLNSDLTDPEQAAMAAHFVHGIRAALQLKTNGESGRVLAITSPSPHNGKTSLSLALGVSFAGAHSRTLLIDCDFVGRALSSRVNAVAHPRLGRVLRHQGLVDDKNLQEALDSAILKGKRLGEALTDMGVVSAEKLKAALDAQKNQAFGVLEAIDGEDLAECVAPTDIPGLSILPLGQANAEHIGSLSPAMLRQVLDTCRKKYDVVIVDTGPILGSLEAAMVATQADDVVVVLSSGENRAAAERSLRYLDSVGAKVAGFVFNRASTRDFVRSDSASRVSSSANRWAHAKNWTHSTQLAAFGPVAQAVARSVGESNSGKANGNGNKNGAGNGNTNGNSRYGQSANGETHLS